MLQAPSISPRSLIPSTPVLCSPFRAPNASFPSSVPLSLGPGYPGTGFQRPPGPLLPTPRRLGGPSLQTPVPHPRVGVLGEHLQQRCLAALRVPHHYDLAAAALPLHSPGYAPAPHTAPLPGPAAASAASSPAAAAAASRAADTGISRARAEPPPGAAGPPPPRP